jgi:short-subunit dehydrogenase
MMRPVVMITGASSGIGASAVGLFAAAGYDVVLAARRKDRLKSVAENVRLQHPEAKLCEIVCDVNSDDSVRDAFAKIRTEFGRLNVLVNNAGYGVYGSVEATSMDVFRANMETNYFGVIRCTQHALPLLRIATVDTARAQYPKRASIIMVSSFVGRRAIPCLASYCASKFALEGLSEALRIELHDQHIAVSVVNPGVTQTEFVQSAQGLRPEAFLSPGKGMSSESVAKVILKLAKKPRPNVYLTSEGRMGLALQWLSPSMFDRIMLRTWRKSVNR